MAVTDKSSKSLKSSFTRERHLLNLESRGFIQGVTIKDSAGKELCHYYGGIPYAEPPLGENRWLKPRELAACYRYGTREAPGRFDGAATVCPQESALLGKTGKFRDGVGEDCLQCVIWVPAGEKPVGGN
jgi:carboxylesterase type B